MPVSSVSVVCCQVGPLVSSVKFTSTFWPPFSGLVAWSVIVAAASKVTAYSPSMVRGVVKLMVSSVVPHPVMSSGTTGFESGSVTVTSSLVPTTGSSKVRSRSGAVSLVMASVSLAPVSSVRSHVSSVGPVMSVVHSSTASAASGFAAPSSMPDPSATSVRMYVPSVPVTADRSIVY